MSAYLVRLDADQKNPHDLVGIFVAASIEQLAEVVDECCDVDACEYSRLPPGGIYRTGPAVRVPAPWDESTPDAQFLKDATVSELRSPYFYQQGKEPTWKPFC